MGRLDLPDVYRDEDDYRYATSAEPTLKGGDGQVGTDPPAETVRAMKRVIPLAGKCAPLSPIASTRGLES